jgi:hypothetical protein
MFLSLLSCGMKGPPVAPQGSVLPSLSDQYLLQPTPTATPNPTPAQ